MAERKDGAARGRPTRFTPQLQDAICQVIKVGATHKMAAAFAEVDIDTFQRWMRQKTAFRNAVRKAEADCDTALVGRIRAAAQSGDWKAAAWLMERAPRTRAEWSLNATLNVAQAPVEVKVTHGLSAGTADALAQLAQLAAALDVMVRVGVVPQLGTGGAGPRSVGPVDDPEDDEVHPA